ncbi:oligosaccharide flippase family protein [Fibrella arboris]|uniref:oligosaccharide flippase family protein n=1 Tax=Fibrella arboris TaxID=3242486 RepID=UPI0035223BEE
MALQSDKKLFTNFLSLGLVQFTNFALPLLTYPYLFRTVGKSYFGAITYAFSLMVYLSALTDYGFNISAPRTVALVQNDRIKLSKIVSIVYQTKIYIFLACNLLLILGLLTIDRLQEDLWLYGLGTLYLAGTCVLPTWLYQGLEDMRHITWINLLAKVVSTLLIFILIKKPEDYQYTVGLFGVANLLSGLIGVFYACRRYKLTLNWQPTSIIIKELKDGFYHFSSSLSSVAFSNSTVFILGLFVSNAIIGSYGIVEKIIFALWQLISIFSQVTYPVICRLAVDSHKLVLEFMRKYYVLFTAVIALGCLLVAFFANEIIYVVTGHYQSDTVTLLRILSIFPFIVCLNVSAYQLLLVYEKQKVNALIFNVSVLLNAIACTVLSSIYGAIGAAYSAIFTQIAVTLSLHWVLATRFPNHSLWAHR